MSSCISDKLAHKRMSSKSPETVTKGKTAKRLKLRRRGRPRKRHAEHPICNSEESNPSQASSVQEVASSHSLPKVDISRNSSVLRSVFSRVPLVTLVREPSIEKELKSVVPQVFGCSETSEVADLRMEDPGTAVCVPNISRSREASIEKEPAKVPSCFKTAPETSNREISVKSEVANSTTFSRLQPCVVLTRKPAIDKKLKSKEFTSIRCDTLWAKSTSYTLKESYVNLPATALQPRVLLTREPAIEQELKLAASRVCGRSETSQDLSKPEISEQKINDPVTFKIDMTTSSSRESKLEVCISITSDSTASEVADSSIFLSAEVKELSSKVTNSSTSENCKLTVLPELEVAEVSFSASDRSMSTSKLIIDACANSEPRIHETAALSDVGSPNSKPNTDARAFLESEICETATVSKIERSTDVCASSELRDHETATLSRVETTNADLNTDACADSELRNDETAASSEVEFFNSNPKADVLETLMIASLPESEMCNSESKTAISASSKVRTVASPSKIKMSNSKPNADASVLEESYETVPSKIKMSDSVPNVDAFASPKNRKIATLSKIKMSDSNPNADVFVLEETYETVLSKMMISDSERNIDSSARPEIYKTDVLSELKVSDFKAKTGTFTLPEPRIYETASLIEGEVADSQPMDVPDIHRSSEFVNPATLTTSIKFSASALNSSHERCSKPKVNVSSLSELKEDYPTTPSLGKDGPPISATNSDGKICSELRDNISSSSTSETVCPTTTTSLGDDKLSVSAMTSSGTESRSKVDLNISTSSETVTAHRATTTSAEKVELFPSIVMNSVLISKAEADMANSKSAPNLKPNDFLASAETDSKCSSKSEAISDLLGREVDSTVIPDLDQNYFSTPVTAKSESFRKSKVVAPTSAECEVVTSATTVNLKQDKFSVHESESLSQSEASDPSACESEEIHSAATTDLESFSKPEIFSGNTKSPTIINPASFTEQRKTDRPTTKFKFSSPAVTKISSTLKFSKSSTNQLSSTMFKFSKPAAIMASHNILTSSDSKNSLPAIPKTSDFENSDPDRVSIVKVHGNEMPLESDKSPILSLSTVTESGKPLESDLAQHVGSHVTSPSSLPKESSPITPEPQIATNHKPLASETDRIVSYDKLIDPLTSGSNLKTSAFEPAASQSQASSEPVSPSLVSEIPLVDLVSSPPKSVAHLSLPKILISDMLKQNRPSGLTASPELEPAVEVESVAAILGHLSPPKMNVSSIFGAFKPKSPFLEPFVSPKATIRVSSSPKVQNRPPRAIITTSKAASSKNMGKTAENNLVLPSSDTPLGVQVTASEQILKNLLSDLTRKFRKDDECSCDEPMESSDLMTTDVPYHTITGCVPVDILNEREITNDNLEIPSWRHKIFTSCYSMEGTENLSDDVFEKRHARLEQEEKRRKRWDVQRIREQRQLDHLRENERKRNWLAKSDDENDKERPRPCSLYPTVSSATRISVDESLPVNALGVVLKKIEPREFSLPWKDGNTSCGFSYDVDTSPRTRRK